MRVENVTLYQHKRQQLKVEVGVQGILFLKMVETLVYSNPYRTYLMEREGGGSLVE